VSDSRKITKGEENLYGSIGQAVLDIHVFVHEQSREKERELEARVAMEGDYRA
jgi:hypothetical protein